MVARPLFFVLAMAAALSGCGASDDAASPGGDTGAGGDPAYTIAVVPKGLGHQFWLTVKQGAEAAGKEFNAKIIWNGPSKETEIAEQINIVEDMITRGVDAIVMAACDENALIDTIQNSFDAGVPVVTIDSGVRSDLPVSFIATDNIAGAVAAADALSELIGGSGEVGLLPFVPGAATSEMRESGFKEGLAKHPGVKLVSTLYSHSDTAKAMAAIEDMMTANPNLEGVFVANEAGAIGAVQAIEAAGKAGEIKLVAFDASEEQIAALKRGTIQALIVQNPFRMGYEGVAKAIDYLEGREVEKRIDTGVTVVTLENLETPEVQKLIYPEV